MYIEKLVMENFRCFPGKTEIEFISGINFLVGNNNCGKTTIFKAIDFLLSGKTKDGWISKGKEDEEVSVIITLKGTDIIDLVQSDALKKYQSYVADERLILRRGSEVLTWEDSKNKNKEINIRNVAVFNPVTQKFENPTGFDSAISALFDAQFVYSDLSNEEYQDFNKTKIIGKLITEVTKNFQKSEIWKAFSTAHDAAFGERGLLQEHAVLKEMLQDVMKNDYGETVVDFQFGVPTIESFIKNGQILLEDNGIKTSIAEKGTGMQRALALSLIQVYSQIANSGDAGSKPIFFFIDEPETFLHPMAQDRLLEAFNTLSEQSQIFVTTHSPYLLRSFDSAKNSLRIFSRDSGNPRIKEITDLNLFPYSPSWGEINYAAFGVVSEEFHNELFSLLHNKARETNQHYDNHNKTVGRSLTSLDDWLNEQPNISKTVVGKHDNFNPKSNNRRDLTMPVYIRNYIDHPGDAPNPQNMRSKPSKAEITNSIQSMLTLIKNIS